jgi:hypothetical protein
MIVPIFWRHDYCRRLCPEEGFDGFTAAGGHQGTLLVPSGSVFVTQSGE